MKTRYGCLQGMCLAAIACSDDTPTPVVTNQPEPTVHVDDRGAPGTTSGRQSPTDPPSVLTQPQANPDAGIGQPGGDAGAGRAAFTVALELVASGLTSPVALQPAPNTPGALLVADRGGTIRTIDAAGELLAEPFLDIADRVVPLDESYDERGLLGLALHPQYADNGRFFVHYSAPLRAEAPAGFDHTSHLSEFRLAADGVNADPSSERVLLQIDQPQTNHNGGHIAFGPDGYLYVALGDGGGANDEGLGHVEDWYEVNAGGNGQDVRQNLLGSILRLDVDAGDPYGIPGDNPFAESGGLPEIWASGFRNPYRMAFDSGGERQLFAGDVGQVLWEEVNIVTAGGNYGWNVKEATHCFSTENPGTPLAECPSQDPEGRPLIDPILEYPHPDPAAPRPLSGIAVVGGHVYRGEAVPELSGHYVFGDWSQSFDTPDGRLFVAVPPANATDDWSVAPLAVADRPSGNLGEYVLSFGEDAAGELYVLTSEQTGPTGETGKVYRLIP